MPTFFTLHYFAAANMKRKLDGKKQFKKERGKKIIIKYYYEWIWIITCLRILQSLYNVLRRTTSIQLLTGPILWATSLIKRQDVAGVIIESNWLWERARYIRYCTLLRWHVETECWGWRGGVQSTDLNPSRLTQKDMGHVAFDDFCMSICYFEHEHIACLFFICFIPFMHVLTGRGGQGTEDSGTTIWK